MRKKQAPDLAVHHALRGCSCQGLEQHHQDTTLKFSPAGPQPVGGSSRARTILPTVAHDGADLAVPPLQITRGASRPQSGLGYLTAES